MRKERTITVLIDNVADRLAEQLRSENEAQRQQAAEMLFKEDPSRVADVLIPMLQSSISDDVHGLCMDILQKTGGCVALDQIRQDHWFDDLKADADPGNFELVAGIIGNRYLAYSILLGLQITRLRQMESPNAMTIVEFTSDSEMIQKLPLSQFNLQVASVLLGIGIHTIRECELPLTEEQALSIIGEMPLLVAPLFDIFPSHLAAVQKGSLFKSVIGMTTPRGKAFLTIDEFHRLILQLLRFDVQRYGQERLAFDFNTGPAVAAYEQQDYAQVISLLETWPGLLSTMLKTPAQDALSEPQLEGIAQGCQLLGSSFIYMGNVQYAEEVLRLGIRYTGDTPFGAQLFLDMGVLLNQEERYGEAIAFLRRATVTQPTLVAGWIALGRALRHRGRRVAAWLALSHAISILHEKEDAMDDADRSAMAEADAERHPVAQAIEEAAIAWPF
ncbi:MAG: tetratricopeptide repeat protein [Deltaproteobacteria bacterium]|nr:tetratricopeptide repeat protein [Deltaproteobacteria bacterium]